MRATLLVCLVASGCAGAARYRPIDAIGGGGCLVDHLAPLQTTGRENQDAQWEDALYRRGQRVPKDDLVAATADDARAHTIATRSARDQKLAVGGLVLGGVVAGSGAGLIGWGVDQDRPAGLGSGAALAVVGAGVVAGSIALIEHAQTERERAIAAYNEDAPPACR